MSFIIDRFKKCRVAYNVYKDEGEVDDEDEEVKKKYALFKIIDFIKDIYKDDLDKQGEAMDKLKKITNNCNPIIEKRFDLSDYLFKQKVLEQTYYDVNNINPANFEDTTFEKFFEKNGLLDDSYIEDNDNEAIIFKLSSNTIGKNLYIRLSRRNLDGPQSNEYLEGNTVKIFKIDIKDKKQLLIYSLINNNKFEIATRALGGVYGQGLEKGITVDSEIHYFNKISINNKTLANKFYTQQKGGIGKKTIKNKSKPLKNTILQKKKILGKDMRIYKINGSKKEYVKYKGNLISISDYKKIIKLKKN